jgi:hypothetical protein
MRAFGIITLFIAMAIAAYLMLGQREPGQPGPSAVQARHIEDKARDTVDMANVLQTQNAVDGFNASKGRLPATLDELKDEGFVQNVPPGLAYDPATGKVSKAP